MNLIGLSERGMQIPESTTFEEWSQLGWNLKGELDGWKWRFGDWLNFGVKKWGDKKALSIDHAQTVGGSNRSVYNYMAVAVEFPICKRLQNLSWCHHLTALLAPASKRDAWLTKAAHKGWSVREFMAALRAASAEKIADKGDDDRAFNPTAIATDLLRWAMDQDINNWPMERRAAVKHDLEPLVKWWERL